MTDILESLNEIIKTIENGIKEGTVPEGSRMYLQRLMRSIQDTIKVIEIVKQEKTIQSPISPSARSAMYNLRKAFYAVLGRLSKEKGVDKEKSISEWKNAAGKLVEFLNASGISEAPTKIVLFYNIIEEDGLKYLKFEKAEVLYFELEGVKDLKL